MAAWHRCTILSCWDDVRRRAFGTVHICQPGLVHAPKVAHFGQVRSGPADVPVPAKRTIRAKSLRVEMADLPLLFCNVLKDTVRYRAILSPAALWHALGVELMHKVALVSVLAEPSQPVPAYDASNLLSSLRASASNLAFFSASSVSLAARILSKEKVRASSILYFFFLFLFFSFVVLFSFLLFFSFFPITIIF